VVVSNNLFSYLAILMMVQDLIRPKSDDMVL
jgi:hypothetical protein